MNFETYNAVKKILRLIYKSQRKINIFTNKSTSYLCEQNHFIVSKEG